MPVGFGTYREGIERLTGLADVDEVLKSLCRLLRKTVKGHWAVVYLFDRERNDFTPARSCGLPTRYRPLFREMPLPPDKIPLLKAILRKEKHLLLPDAGKSKLLTPKLRTLLQGTSLLAVPMVIRNQVMGAVLVARTNVHLPFSADEIAITRMLVSHAALVASHIRLFDESLEMAVDMARRIDVIFTLDDINKAISSSLSHEKIMETAMEHIERMIQCKFVGVLVEEKGKLMVRAARADGITIPSALSPGTEVKGSSLAGIAFAKGETRYIPSLGSKKPAGPVGPGSPASRTGVTPRHPPFRQGGDSGGIAASEKPGRLNSERKMPLPSRRSPPRWRWPSKTPGCTRGCGTFSSTPLQVSPMR